MGERGARGDLQVAAQLGWQPLEDPATRRDAAARARAVRVTRRARARLAEDGAASGGGWWPPVLAAGSGSGDHSPRSLSALALALAPDQAQPSP
eukprot:5734877-Prymnesium_polylepis.2